MWPRALPAVRAPRSRVWVCPATQGCGSGLEQGGPQKHHPGLLQFSGKPGMLWLLSCCLAKDKRVVWDTPASAMLLLCTGSLGEDGAILACLNPQEDYTRGQPRGGVAWVRAYDGAAGARRQAGQEAGSCPLQQNH